ncbi:helix-turn-helix domain-containing protein [Streptantibioticus silvisoli]|uniref:Helix-turn-helix transcriptional regulator n=1 Tax=Streptantibioticus silvisoli TaxID=2705255 RepID=A0ABT6VWS6_9ACTN|nr:helix-turn-helix transcriptional regulator [Streptantibioticus silvisoli]MDI5962941.1 helix-turn-helix transcriptional regulator [Streptantibioticus silvisoli]
MTQSRNHTGPDDEDDVPEWVDQVMATVAAEVRRRRKEMGMSAQDLADACAERGHPIPRNVIANMESGRRATLPLVDVIVLADALETSPILLLYPLGHTDRVQTLPLTDPESAWDALLWFTGEASGLLGGEDPMLRAFRAHQYHQAAARTAARDADHARWEARTANTPEEREDAQRSADHYAATAAHHRDRLRTARAFIREDGGTPPPLHPDLHGIDPEADDPEEHL